MGQLLEYINYKNMKTLEYNAQTGETTERELTPEEVAQAEKLMPTESELVKQSIEQKLQEITDYDSSDSVNSFSINGVNTWLTEEKRNSYLTSIQAAELLGETSVTFGICGQSITLDLHTAKIMLAKLQRYADACYLVTMQHKEEVEMLTTVAEVESIRYY
jgi:hypothetical protein